MGLREALVKRYQEPEWAVLWEVRSHTGYSGGQERYADMVAMNLWPSRGMEIHGIEIKTDRGDWLRELKDPAKAERISKYCDRWYLATTDGVLKPGELPGSWGHLLLRKTKLYEEVEAPKREVVPLTKTFIASMLSRSVKTRQDDRERLEREFMEKTNFHGRVKVAVDKAVEKEKAALSRQISSLQDEVSNLKRQIEDFNKSSGIDLGSYRWRLGQVGEAVRYLMRGGANGEAEHLRQLLGVSINLQAAINQTLACIESIKKEP